MVPPVALIGQRFNRLTVVDRAENDRFGKSRWRCRCDCGGETITRANTLLKGETQSCGCLHAETVKVNNLTHGDAKHGQRSPIYKIWCAAKGRCHNPTDKGYKRYGGRGIVMCERWREDFAAFRDDMGPRPAGHTLERKDNNGPYSPENCVWATHKTQGRNREGTIRIVHAGKALTLGEWAEQTGIPESALYFRIHISGWTPAKALTTPSRGKSKAHRVTSHSQ